MNGLANKRECAISNVRSEHEIFRLVTSWRAKSSRFCLSTLFFAFSFVSAFDFFSSSQVQKGSNSIGLFIKGIASPHFRRIYRLRQTPAAFRPLTLAVAAEALNVTRSDAIHRS